MLHYYNELFIIQLFIFHYSQQLIMLNSPNHCENNQPKRKCFKTLIFPLFQVFGKFTPE